VLGQLNQTDGFDCPGCAWPGAEHRSVAEFCENGANALEIDDGDLVDLISNWSDGEWTAPGFRVVSYPTPRGCLLPKDQRPGTAGLHGGGVQHPDLEIDRDPAGQMMTVSLSIQLDGLRVLETFSLTEPAQDATAIARKLAMQETSVRQVLAHLEQAGYLEWEGGSNRFRCPDR